MWTTVDEIWDALEGQKLVWTTVSRFSPLFWSGVDKGWDIFEGKEHGAMGRSVGVWIAMMEGSEGRRRSRWCIALQCCTCSSRDVDAEND